MKGLQPDTTQTSGELTAALDISGALLMWPWGLGTQVQEQLTMGPQGWPGHQVPLGSSAGAWQAPYSPTSFSNPTGVSVGVGGWPYPSVPDTGYNSIPLMPLPFRDYALPIGDHLTSVMREHIRKDNA